MLSKRRRGIHASIGKAIESLHAQRLDEFYEILAYHYSKGENSEKAYHYLKLSGNKAIRNYANREAFRFYKEAIDVLSKMPETEENKRKQIDGQSGRGRANLIVKYGDFFFSAMTDFHH